MVKSTSIYQFIKSLAEREGVSEDRIKEIIIESFRRSYCKKESSRAELNFKFNDGLSVHRLYQIVEKVNDPEKEISKNDELLKKGKVKNNKLFVPLDIKNFSNSLSDEIRKQLLGDLGEISKARQFKQFKPLEGQIVEGTIQKEQENYYLIKLKKGGIGYLKKEELALPEVPKLGQKFLFFLIKEVKENAEKNMPQIILTRHDNLFIHRLLEQEIPQVKEGIITVQHILRIPGLVSKIVVEKSKKAIEKGLNINPFGACIGEKGKRVHNLLSPAKVVEIIEKGDGWYVTVLGEKTSLVLEHHGKLLEKIADYLGKKIHVRGLEEIRKEKSTIIVWNGKLDDKEIEMLCKRINN
nr:10664_t:CDS:2 [Entrophospora candida]